MKQRSSRLNILVKAPNWAGDCVMATPAIRLLRRSFPDSRIDVLSRISVAGVLSGNPDIQEVIIADDRQISRDVFERMRTAEYDAMALFPNSFGVAWLALNLRIPRRIGFSRNGRSLLLTHRCKYSPWDWQTPTPQPLSRKSIRPKGDKSPEHMVDYYLSIAHKTVSALSGVVPADFSPELVLVPPEKSVARVEELLGEQGIADKQLAGINPGAAYGTAKRWVPEYLAKVADQLAADGYAVVSTASIKEQELTAAVQQHAKCVIHPLGAQLDLPGLVALAARLRILVSNDSGAMHIAAALKVPIVAIFGPTDWNVTYPWSPNALVVRQSPPCAPCFLRECPIDHRCMTNVTPDQVLTAAKELLAVSDSQ